MTGLGDCMGVEEKEEGYSSGFCLDWGHSLR